MNKKSMILFIFIVTILLLANVFVEEVRANASYILVTANTIPTCDPLNNGPALCFQFDGTGPLSPLLSIPESYLNYPTYVVFNHQGELFIGNRHGCIGGGVGSIARFLLNNTGNFIPNGIIEGNELENVHGLAFSSTGELFAANSSNGTISRFQFDENGNAIPNGIFYTEEVKNQGLAFNSNGELFTTHSNSEVRRFVFNSNSEAIFNGSFNVPGSSRLHGLCFNEQGQLFIGDPDNNLIYRILFDESGNPISNGSISVSGGPVGGFFSPEGELFVTSHFEGRITRFLFDENGLPIPNGSIIPNCDHLGGIAIFAFPPTGPMAVAEPGLDENNLLILNGSLSSDPYKTIVSWNWALTNRDPSGNNFTLAGEILPTNGIDIGVYDVTLAVTNNEGLIGIDTMALAIPKCTPTDIDNDGYSVEMGDCDDNNPEINPGAAETCDEKDNNCNGQIDEGFDLDEDGFTQCGGDCNDLDNLINPTAIELPGNTIDENCDGSLGDCDPYASWKNHGEYVKCVSHEVKELVNAGLITDDEGDNLVKSAAQSDIGKK